MSNISFSCPSLYLNMRSGVMPTDTILYQVMDSTNITAKVEVAKNMVRLELEENYPGTNLSTCYTVLHFLVSHSGDCSEII